MWLCSGRGNEGEGHGDFTFDLVESNVKKKKKKRATSKCSLSPKKKRQTNEQTNSFSKNKCQVAYLSVCSANHRDFDMRVIPCASPNCTLRGIKGGRASYRACFQAPARRAAPRSQRQKVTLLCVGRSSSSAECTASGRIWSKRPWRGRGHPASQHGAKHITGIY